MILDRENLYRGKFVYGVDPGTVYIHGINLNHYKCMRFTPLKLLFHTI